MKQDVLEPGVVYHIFNRGNNKENIFKEEKNYEYFLQLVEKYLIPVADIYAYCLLKNHFHFLLKIKDLRDLPEEFKKKPFLPFSHLFNAYTKAVNKMYNRSGSLFQEHLKRKRVENEKYFIQLIAYIHLNPVHHKFVDDHKNYKFSSYQSYVGERERFINPDSVFDLMDRENFVSWHNFKKLEMGFLENHLGDEG